MSEFIRPDVQVRLIGPAATVQSCVYHFVHDLRVVLGRTKHVSVHTTSARHSGEVRTYILVRRREAPR